MTQQEISSNALRLSAGLSSTQLNIVALIDVPRALRAGSLDGCAALMDNSPKSVNKGSAALQTVCRQGQTLNWLVYCMDNCRRCDGSWPPFARIVNIVFVREDGSVFSSKVCDDLKVYGGPDAVRSPLVPVYYYWAGTVMPDLETGLYEYRLVIECDTGYAGQKRYFDLNGPALRVVEMEDMPAAV